MGADVSKIRNNPLFDFAGVELKQGGVILDADFNEMSAIVDRRLRAAASDILGRATVSATTPEAFKVTDVGGTLHIGKGRLYVDGLLAENHSGVPNPPVDPLVDPRFDSLLAEPTLVEPVTYGTQPYLPNLATPPVNSPSVTVVRRGGTTLPPLPTKGRHVVYLDVWDREVTHLEQPKLVEIAVGVEASSRRQTVWQVRVINESAGAATCATADADLPGWSALIAPSAARLTTGTFEMLAAADPCELRPSGGYRGLENQTYRVEIHDRGKAGAGATFKWSRDNASVGSRVAQLVSATSLELDTLGRDELLSFHTGDWVEIIDDARELAQRCGEIRQVTVPADSRAITFTSPLPADMLPATLQKDFARVRNLRVRRWDHARKVLQAGAGGTTSVYWDLDATASHGVIPVPKDGTVILLENGVTVSFASASSADFRAGDHWVFAARTADSSVEMLDKAPPRGIHHHYARLGIWDLEAGSVSDCRKPWPPHCESCDGSCTQAVTAESHRDQSLTIQDAVDRLRDTGGTVCLGVGWFLLEKPVRLARTQSVRIRGQGAATLLIAPGGGFSIENAVALAIEEMAILSYGRDPAISVRTVLGLSLQRLIIAVVGADARGPAIALSGVVAGVVIRDNAIFAPVAVQAPAAGSADSEFRPADYLISALLRVEDNLLWCERRGVAFAGLSLHLLATRITGNEILGCRGGAITALGMCGPGGSMRIADNSLNLTGPGITAGVDGLWIEGNKLVAAGAKNANDQGWGIALRAVLDRNGADECQILANQISGFEDAGILIDSPVGELIVKSNIIQRCGNGIVARGEARVRNVSIEGNHIADIGIKGAQEQSEVVGIGLQAAESATVSGNTVRRIGQLSGGVALRAGISTVSVRRLRVTGNEVSDIGSHRHFDKGFAVGILVRSPYAEAEVSHNRVDRESQPLLEGGGPFLALFVDEPLEIGVFSRIGLHAIIRLSETITVALGAARPSVRRAPPLIVDATLQAPPGGANVSVLGNNLATRGDQPVVLVRASGDCLFSDNRCELRGGDTKAAVDLTATTAIVSSNRVRGGNLTIRVHLKRATVLGNIVSGGILLGLGQPGSLGTPWIGLNRYV